MGVTYVDGRVTGPTGHSERIRFLVDSGAQYSLLPSDVWKRISQALRTRSPVAIVIFCWRPWVPPGMPGGP